MNCTNCNQPLEANAKFCGNCGTPIQSLQPQNINQNNPTQDASYTQSRPNVTAQPPYQYTAPSPPQEYIQQQPAAATTPLILGILGIVLFMFTPLSLLLGIIGLVIGIIDAKKHKTHAVIAIVLSCLAIGISLLLLPTFMNAFLEEMRSSGY